MPGRVARLATAAGSRRDLLPDVDEINQTLRSGPERRVTDNVEERVTVDTLPRRSGFGRGFFLVILLMVIALAVYVFAPQLADMVPGAADPLNAYVAQVDALRIWLDSQVTALMQTLDGMSSESTGEPATE